MPPVEDEAQDERRRDRDPDHVADQERHRGMRKVADVERPEGQEEGAQQHAVHRRAGNADGEQDEHVAQVNETDIEPEVAARGCRRK
ncbi:MAG: hypothetical protein M5U33_13240 [Pseudorhodoplanes sp.]|nr:hypothetical protein [Pseudorhodoplanes sp.]